MDSLLFHMMIPLSITVIIFVLILSMNHQCKEYTAVKALGFNKKNKWQGLFEGIYSGKRVEILISLGTISVYFNDYSKPNLQLKSYFCLTEKSQVSKEKNFEDLLKEEGILSKQLSAKLRSDFKNFLVKYNKYSKYKRRIKLCAYGRSLLFSKKSGTVVFCLPIEIFENADFLKEALDIAVEAAKETEKVKNRNL